MRLYKKAAVCVLAAAMALSMLTACGGGGGGTSNGGTSGGNTGTVEPAPKPDDVVLPDTGKDDGDDSDSDNTAKPTKTPIEVSKSKTAAFNNKIKGATEFYYAGNQAEYNAAGKQTGEMNGVMALKDSSVYVKMSGKDADKSIAMELLQEKNAAYIYASAEKAALKMDNVKFIDASSVDLSQELPSQIWATKVTVGKTEYYAETYTESGIEYTTCFGTDGNPKYAFMKHEDGSMESMAYQSIRVGAGASQNLCKVPSDYKVYTYARNAAGEEILVDQNGNKYTVEPLYDVYGNVTSVTVKDQNGKDVTNNFKWLADLVEMMGTLSLG